MERAWRTVLGLLVVYAAPVAALWNELVKARPAVAVLLAMAWLAITTVGWLFWRMTAESINKRLSAVGTDLDRRIDQRFSRYGKQYRQWVMDSRRFMDAKGLATVGTFSPELDEVFVDVGLTSRAPQQVPPDLLGSAATDDTGRRSIWDFLDQPDPVVLAVIGAPGSGKTTLLNHVARRSARTYRERRRTVPVLLQLRDHAKAVVAEPGISLPELIRRAVPELPIPEPAGWWDGRLNRGKCVVLLDGLDEVASAAERRDIVAWTNAQIAVHPRNDFVVTSRPHGYRDAFVRSATTLQVLSFTLEQVRVFLHAWYLAVERRATGTAGREVELMAEEAADDLLDRLAEAPALYDLTINPLLLTMIANVHRFRRSLPNSRADLYGEVCQVMLWRRQEAKRMDLNLPGVSKERLLAWLAFQMMRAGTRDIGRRQLLDGIRPRLRRVSAEVTAEDFVADIGSNGLLVERDRDQYAFAHLTFQEYLAARYIQEHGLDQVLVDTVDDPWWREVTLLYLAGADADPIVQAALRSGTPTALSLAFECAEIGAELAPDLREQLTRVLDGAFRPDADPPSRRLVAGVLASRYLRRLVPTPSGSRVCPDPIAGDLYWLFCRDTGTPVPDGLRTRNPARGMWSEDATSFVAWLNALTSATGNASHHGAGLLYRLPTTAELGALLTAPGPAGQILRSRAGRVWSTIEGSAIPSVWTLPGEPAPNTVSTKALAAAATAGLRTSAVLTVLLSHAAVEAAAGLALTGTPIHRAAEELASLTSRTRSGEGMGGNDTAELVEGLNSRLSQALRLAGHLSHGLHQLSTVDLETVRRIREVIARYPVAAVVLSLERAASLDRDVAIVLDHNRDLGLDRVIARARRLRDLLERSSAQLRKFAENPSDWRAELSPLDRRLGLDLAPVTVGELRAPPVAAAAGLRTAIQPLLRESGPELSREPVERFAATLVRLALREDAVAVPVDLSLLARRLPRAARAAALPPWASAVLHRLIATAGPVLAREHPMEGDDVLALLVPALVLAAEAAQAGDGRLRESLLGLAAASCLLPDRIRHPRSLETLILATA